MNTKNKLLKPAFLLPLALLLLNDHLLKSVYPGWITGKISDFAGLFVMAVFVYAITGRLFKSNKLIIIMHVIIGVAFVVWKTAQVEIVFAEINRFVAIPLPSRVKDATDLIALSVLPLSYLYITRFRNVAVKSIKRVRFNKAITVGILIITGIAIIATSPGRSYKIMPDMATETESEYEEILALFKQTLIDQGVTIQRESALDNTTHSYKIEFKHPPFNHRYSDHKDDIKYLSFVRLVYSLTNKTISIESIDGWVTYDLPKDDQVDKLYMNKIIEPFLKKLRATTGD